MNLFSEVNNPPERNRHEKLEKFFMRSLFPDFLPVTGEKFPAFFEQARLENREDQLNKYQPTDIITFTLHRSYSPETAFPR